MPMTPSKITPARPPSAPHKLTETVEAVEAFGKSMETPKAKAKTHNNEGGWIPEDETWWMWQPPPLKILHIGGSEMLRPKFRPHGWDAHATARDAYEQAVVEYRRIAFAHRQAQLPGHARIGLMPQDLGGYHKRQDEPTTLFRADDHTDAMSPAAVSRNIRWWHEVFYLFLKRWQADSSTPGIEGIIGDWEAEHRFPDKGRDSRFAQVISAAYVAVHPDLPICNWSQNQFLPQGNAVLYRPSQTQIDIELANLDGTDLERTAWISRATRVVEGRVWTSREQHELIQQLREKGFKTFIYWSPPGSDTPHDWESLYRAMLNT